MLLQDVHHLECRVDVESFLAQLRYDFELVRDFLINRAELVLQGIALRGDVSVHGSKPDLPQIWSMQLKDKNSMPSFQDLSHSTANFPRVVRLEFAEKTTLEHAECTLRMANNLRSQGLLPSEVEELCDEIQRALGWLSVGTPVT